MRADGTQPSNTVPPTTYALWLTADQATPTIRHPRTPHAPTTVTRTMHTQRHDSFSARARQRWSPETHGTARLAPCLRLNNDMAWAAETVINDRGRCGIMVSPWVAELHASVIPWSHIRSLQPLTMGCVDGRPYHGEFSTNACRCPQPHAPYTRRYTIAQAQNHSQLRRAVRHMDSRASNGR